MNISFNNIENVKQIKMLSSSATFGIGFLTWIVYGICSLTGTQCKMYDKKIEKAKNSAANQLVEKATAVGANGIMNVQFQIHGITVFMYGIAYIEN